MKTTERGASSPNIIKEIEYKMRWAGHVARVEGRRDACTVFVGGGMQGRDHLGDLGADGRMILKFFCRE